MQIHAIAPVLLIVSIALSWNCFVAIFDGASPVADATRLLPMLASTVCITSLGLAFSGGPWPVGVLMVAAGLALGRFAQGTNMPLAVSLSAALLLTYLRYGVPDLQWS